MRYSDIYLSIFKYNKEFIPWLFMQFTYKSQIFLKYLFFIIFLYLNLYLYLEFKKNKLEVSFI